MWSRDGGAFTLSQRVLIAVLFCCVVGRNFVCCSRVRVRKQRTQKKHWCSANDSCPNSPQRYEKMLFLKSRKKDMVCEWCTPLGIIQSRVTCIFSGNSKSPNLPPFAQGKFRISSHFQLCWHGHHLNCCVLSEHVWVVSYLEHTCKTLAICFQSKYKHLWAGYPGTLWPAVNNLLLWHSGTWCDHNHTEPHPRDPGGLCTLLLQNNRTDSSPEPKQGICVLVNRIHLMQTWTDKDNVLSSCWKFRMWKVSK